MRRHDRASPGTSRRTRLGTRLLATVLVPIAALTAVSAFDARTRLREVDAAAAVEDEVGRADRALDAFLHLESEGIASEVYAFTSMFDLSVEEASELLADDVAAQLEEARDGLDRTGVAVPELARLRRAVDDGTAEPGDLQRRFAEVSQRLERDYFASMDVLGTLTYETHGSADVRRAARGLALAADTYAAAAYQNTQVARLLVPSLDREEAAELLVVASLQFERSTDGLLDQLTPRARRFWRERIETEPAVARFERIIAEQRAASATGSLDAARLAGIFGAGLTRQYVMAELVRIQSAGVLAAADALDAEARSALHREVAVLGALIVFSVVITALTARSIVMPLRRLARRATEVSAGQIDGSPLPVQGPREVAVVTSAFNETVGTLQTVAAQAAALAAAELDHPALDETVPGLVGEDLRQSVARLSQSMRDNEELRQSLARKATHDALTGLPNRVLLLDRLEHALDRAGRLAGQLAVVFVDLDHFKVVNDAKGHGAGDRLLVEVARRIRDSLRAGDTVARFGGDEFVIVLEGVDGAESAAAICEGIRTRLEEPFEIDGAEVVVTASQGIALAGPGETAEDLLRAADAAMYTAKEHGRSRAEVADEGTRRRAAQRLLVEGGLRRALDNDEFVVHFQPVVRLADGIVVGAEALVRWQDPDRGLIPPDRFIPVAEETGLIVPLGEHVLVRALREMASWPATATGALPYVAVNVSGRQFVVPGFAEVVARAVAEAEVDPGRVHLELTESVLMRDIDRSITTLDEISAQGVRIAVDDFGTGYSSLRYVQRLPIDTLKIDKSFIDLLEHDSRDASIVTAVVDLARALGIDTVAEGVETAKQVEALRRLNCRFAQGYFFARPMPADEFTDRFWSGRPPSLVSAV